VLVRGQEEKHAEGSYFLNYNNQWIAVGDDASQAHRKRMLRLNQMEYARLSGRSLAAGSAGQPMAEFSGRKIIKDEVEAYLANLELAKQAIAQSTCGVDRQHEPVVAISFGFCPRATAQFPQVQQCPALSS
jgi:hypothetical protein